VKVIAVIFEAWILLGKLKNLGVGSYLLWLIVRVFFFFGP
jgi:hypothetical protein